MSVTICPSFSYPAFFFCIFSEPEITSAYFKIFIDIRHSTIPAAAKCKSVITVLNHLKKQRLGVRSKRRRAM